jgi:hypothetical protein
MRWTSSLAQCLPSVDRYAQAMVHQDAASSVYPTAPAGCFATRRPGRSMDRPTLPYLADVMTSYRPLLIILGILATSTALCASGPKSYLDGHPQTKTDPQLYPVQIIAVDGTMQNDNPVRVTPGPHWLEVVGPKGAATGAPKSQTFVLKIEPCTYYYIGAHKDSAVMDKWKLVVDEEDTIKECDPAEEIRNAKAASAQGAPKTVAPVAPVPSH